MATPGVTAPIASATTREQLASLVAAADLALTDVDMRDLDAAGV
jgi:aryl-alcohol dehydrogenase-like predicted oxidoreductase